MSLVTGPLVLNHVEADNSHEQEVSRKQKQMEEQFALVKQLKLETAIPTLVQVKHNGNIFLLY